MELICGTTHLSVHSGEKGSPGEIKTSPGDPGQKGEKGLSGNPGPDGETDPSTVALSLILILNVDCKMLHIWFDSAHKTYFPHHHQNKQKLRDSISHEACIHSVSVCSPVDSPVSAGLRCDRTSR